MSKKRLLVMTLILSMVFLFIAGIPTTKANAASYYTLKAGDVNISNGKITSFKKSIKDINTTSIIIPSKIGSTKITEIGKGAFQNKGLTHVKISYGITKIYRCAFQKNKIVELKFPCSLEFIGEDAFLENSLKAVTFPNGLKTIGKGAFYYNKSLSSINMPQSVTEVGIYAFWGTKVKSFKLPAAYTYWISYDKNGKQLSKYEGSTNVSNFKAGYKISKPYTLKAGDVSISNGKITSFKKSVKDIKTTSIIVPSKIGSSRITEIGNSAFQNKGITHVQISHGITKIDRYAFKKNKIVELKFPSSLEFIGEDAFLENSLKAVTFPNGLKTIGKGAFYYNKSLSSINMPQSVTEVGIYAFWGTKVKSFKLPAAYKYQCWISYDKDGKQIGINEGNTNVSNFKAGYKISKPYTLKAGDVNISNGKITSFKKSVKDIKTTSIIVPSKIGSTKITEIGKGVFSNKGLTHVQISQGITKIDRYAFQKNRIVELNLPTSLEVIGEDAFLENSLKEVTFSNGLKTIGKGAFYNNKSLSSINMPQSVTEVGIYAFWGTKVKSFKLPAAYKYECWISYDKDGNELSMHGGNTKVSNFKAKYKKSQSYRLKAGDVDISNGKITSFKKSVKDINTTSIIVPSRIGSTKITEIGKGVFSNKGLTHVQISQGITKIDRYAFQKNRIVELNLPSSLEFIGEDAFLENSLKAVTFSNGLETIGKGAFYKNKSLSSINMPQTVTEIGIYAFWGTQVKSFRLPLANQYKYECWISYDKDGNELSMNYGNKNVSNYKAKYKKIKPYWLKAGDVNISNGKITSFKKSIKDINTTSIIIPSEIGSTKITEIGKSAFQNKGLTRVQITQGITKIDRYAFQKNKIVELKLPTSLEFIGEDAFLENSLTEVTFPNGLKTIGKGAFYNNKSLSSINMPYTVTDIGIYAFWGTQVKSFKLPSHKNSDMKFLLWKAYDSKGYTSTEYDGSSSINEYRLSYKAIFENNTVYTLKDKDVEVKNGVITKLKKDNIKDITKIIIPSKLKNQKIIKIGKYAFQKCNLTNVVISEGVVDIDDYAFLENCIRSVQLPKTLQRIGEDAFKNNILRDVKLPHGLVCIEKGAFYKNTSLKEITIPKSVDFIGMSAFRYCNISSINLPIPEDKDGLEFSHWVLEGDFKPRKTKSNGNETFSLQERGEDTGKKSFVAQFIQKGSYTLKDDDVVIENGVIKEFISNYENRYYSKIILPGRLQHQYVTGVESSIFRNMDSVTLPSVDLPLVKQLWSYKGETNQTKTYYYGGQNIKGVETWDLKVVDFFSQCAITSQNAVIDKGVIVSLKGKIPEKIDCIIIPDEIDGKKIIGIGDNLFKGMGIKHLELPSHLEVIGEYAFAANNLTKVNFPNKVKTIKGNAFSNNKILYNDYTYDDLGGGESSDERKYYYDAIPDSVIHIGENAFYGNEFAYINLKKPEKQGYENTWRITETDGKKIKITGYTNKLDCAFNINTIRNHTVLENEVTIENGVIKNFNLSKKGNEYEFLVLTIPSSIKKQTVKGVGDNAFSGKNLLQVKLPLTVEWLGKNAFSNNLIESVELPSGLLVIGESAFINNQLKSITMPDSITDIGKNAFSSNFIESFILPKAIKPECEFFCWEDSARNQLKANHKVSESAFSYSYKAMIDKAVVLKGSDVTIKKGVITEFKNNNLINIAIPESLQGQTIIGIGENVFKGKNLYKIKLPETLTKISKYAFDGNKLEYLVLPSSKKPKSEFMHWKSSENVFYDGGSKTAVYDTSYEAIFKKNENYILTNDDLSIEKGVIKRLKNTSYDCIVIPDSIDDMALTSVYKQAFNNKGLVDVAFTNNIKNIGRKSFANNKLTDIKLPEGLQVIGDSAFSGNKLMGIQLPVTVIEIGEEAFDDNKFDSFVLPTPIREGYYFKHWVSSDGENFEGGEQVSVEEGYTALFIEILSDDDSIEYIDKENIKSEVVDSEIVLAVDEEKLEKACKGVIEDSKELLSEDTAKDERDDAGDVSDELNVQEAAILVIPEAEMVEGIDDAEIELSADAMQSLSDNDVFVQVDLGNTQIVIPSEVLGTDEIEGVDKDDGSKIIVESNDVDEIVEKCPVFSIGNEKGEAIGQAYEFSILLENEKGVREEIDEKFKEPVMVSIQLSNEDLKNVDDPDSLTVVWYDPVTKKTEVVEAAFNRETSELTFMTYHFSIFLILDIDGFEDERRVDLQHVIIAIIVLVSLIAIIAIMRLQKRKRGTD